MVDSLTRLYDSVRAASALDPGTSKTARLFRDGVHKMAKKLAEEAVEVGLDALGKDRTKIVQESADLLYHLCVLWAETGVHPADVFVEVERRERLLGIAEKIPKRMRKIEPPQAAAARRRVARVR